MNKAGHTPTVPLASLRGAWPRLLQHAAWPRLAGALMLLGALLLLAGWVMPELWRPPWSARRPWGFGLCGSGALLMWLRDRHLALLRQREHLSRLAPASPSAYEFAPVTLPMALPDDAPAVRPAERHGAHPPDATSGTDEVTTGNTTQGAEHAGFGAPRSAPPSLAAAAPRQWSQALLNGIDAPRFQALCEEIFKQDGYVTRLDPPEADSGADLRLHSRLDLSHPVRIVLCRPWQAEAIGVPVLRSFLGALVDADLKSGAILSAASFTPQAEAFASRHGITLVDGKDLLTLIARRPPAQQQHLLGTATGGSPE